MAENWSALAEKANRLLELLELIKERRYADESLIQEAKRLNGELAPVYQVLYNNVPLISTHYPPRVWWPRAKENASQALAAIESGLVSMVVGSGTARQPDQQESSASESDDAIIKVQAVVDYSGLRCFVIGPIGDRLATVGSPERTIYEESIEVLEKVIEPACAVFNIEPRRADQIQRAGEIPEQVFRELRDADLVIADLTGANPNVMYELGLRHTKQRLTLQIGERGRLPFDVQTIRTHQFTRSETGLIDIRRTLESAIRVGLNEGWDDVTATRVWNSSPPDTENGDQDGPGNGVDEGPTKPGVSPIGVIEDDRNHDVELEEEGLLEKLVQMERTFPEISVTLNQTTELLETMGRLATEAGEEAQKVDQRGGSFATKLAIVQRFSERLAEPASTLLSSADLFEAQLAAMDPAVQAILDQLENEFETLEESDREAASELLDSIRFLASQSSQAMAAFNQLATVVEGTKSVSKAMRRPANTIVKALQRYVRAADIITSWDSGAERLQDLLFRSDEDTP